MALIPPPPPVDASDSLDPTDCRLLSFFPKLPVGLSLLPAVCTNLPKLPVGEAPTFLPSDPVGLSVLDLDFKLSDLGSRGRPANSSASSEAVREPRSFTSNESDDFCR